MTRPSDQDLDLRCINTLRTLAIDQVQQANSGYPGMPMGAEPPGPSHQGQVSLCNIYGLTRRLL
ncbi:MAG: hypothetical protein WBM40_12475 [Thiohalocapsa sp.]